MGVLLVTNIREDMYQLLEFRAAGVSKVITSTCCPAHKYMLSRMLSHSSLFIEGNSLPR